MIQPYLILVSGIGIFGILQHRKKLNLKTKQIKRQLEREQRKLNMATRAENLLRSRVSLKEKSRKLQESLAQIGVLMRKAETQFAREEWKDAERNLVQVLSFDEHNIKANRLLGFTYLHRGEWKRAELVFKKLIELEPKGATHFGNLGLAFYRLGKYPLAREAYLNATRLDGSKAARWMSLGQIYLKLKDFEAAASAFRRAVKIDHRNLDYLFAFAEAHESGSNYAAAAKVYEHILDLSPYNEGAKERLTQLKK